MAIRLTKDGVKTVNLKSSNGENAFEEQQKKSKLFMAFEECASLFEYPRATKRFILELSDDIKNDPNANYDAEDCLRKIDSLCHSNLTRLEKTQVAELADEMYDYISD